jgi:hypothetical protein
MGITKKQNDLAQNSNHAALNFIPGFSSVRK